MSNDTSRLGRELTIDELNAVTGGVSYEGQCTPCHGSRSSGGPPSEPANAAAMRAWNNLLTQYGY
jgi:bacteriocin-like protein